MEVRQIDDPARFLELAEPLLAVDEARHNLLYGLAGTLREDRSSYPVWHLWLVEDRGRPLGAALRTPPFNLVLARPVEDAALTGLADSIASEGIELPGVTGAVPEVDRFAAAWLGLTGATGRVRMKQRIYALTKLRPVDGVAGAARLATGDDVELLRAWMRAFVEESMSGGEHASEENVERVVQGRLSRPNAGFLLWEDVGQPVSVAGWGAPTPKGIRIGPVYTPPRLRRRGYASALVADLSARQLAAGRRFCFLYTDAANPTSNRIYANLGYEHVCDSREVAFEAQDG